jgi:xanthine/uracil permease
MKTMTRRSYRKSVLAGLRLLLMSYGETVLRPVTIASRAASTAPGNGHENG